MSQTARSCAYDQLTAPDIPAQLSRQSSQPSRDQVSIRLSM